MDVFHEIHSQLNVFRSLLRRREALRVGAYIVAGLLLVGLAGPLFAAVAADKTVVPLRAALVAVAGVAALGALVAGIILPRRRLRKDAEVARLVGAAAPQLASDLLSTVELERELRGEPKFSRALAVALAEDTRLRLDMIDPERVAPRRRARRAGLVLGAVVVVYGAIALVLPRPLRAGWSRLANPPAINSITDRAAPVSEPLVGDIQLVLTYPAYTRRAPLVVPAATGDVVAPRGTKVALETTALRPAASARLVFEREGKEEPQPLTVEGRTVRGAFVVDRPSQFRFVLQPAEGRALVEADSHRIEIEADRAPRVELIAPADELDVSSRRRVELAYSIDDDYGIGEIALIWKGGGKEERKVLPLPPAGARTAQAKFYWDLNEINIAPGTRIAYHLEVKDNDDVGGPNLGSSKTLYLRVYSPRERHEEVMARQQAVFEEAVRTLAQRLEINGDDLDAHRGAIGELDRLVIDVASLLTLIGADTLTPKGLKEEVEGIHQRLEKLGRDEQGAVSEYELRRSRVPGFVMPRGALGEHDRRVVAELERDVLSLDDWMSRQRLEELLSISDELKQHRAKLKDLMAQYQRTQSPELRAEIEREIRAIEQRIAELQAKASQLSSEVSDRFMNSEAMNADDAQDCFAKVRALLDKGDVVGAEKQLEICSKQAEEQAQSLEEGLRGLRGERFSEEEKAYGELLGEIAGLEQAQRKVAKEADDLLDHYKEKAAQELKARSSPQQEKARKTLDHLKNEVGDVPREGLTPFAQEELDALKKRLDDVGQMLDEGDVAEALSMARHAQDELRTIGTDIEDDLADGRPASAKSRDAEDRVGRSLPLARQLIEELQQATPSPQEMMTPEDLQRLGELRKRQKELRERTQKMGQKAQKKAGELPGQAGEMAQKGLDEAAGQMGRAEDRMGAPDPMGSRDEAQGAADKLGELQNKMQRSSRPSSVSMGENGRGFDDDTVKIPGSEEYKPPEAFREDILDAMKKDKPPDAYKDQVKRYYEELVK